jgi:hypothetical protein
VDCCCVDCVGGVAVEGANVWPGGRGVGGTPVVVGGVGVGGDMVWPGGSGVLAAVVVVVVTEPGEAV